MNYSLLRSRTFWTIVAMFIIGGINSVKPVIPLDIVPYIEFALGALASYFHLDTAVKFGARN